MMRIFFIMAISCLVFSCNAKEKKNDTSDIVQKDSITVVNDSLKIKANQLKEAYSKNNYFGFFKLFPNTFDEFLKLYGYDDEKGENNILALVCEDHIDFFFASYELNKESFIPKMFNLVKVGHWEADAPSTLQDNIEKFIKLHTKEVIDYLITKPDIEVTGFWYFVFDGSSRNDLQNKDKFNNIYQKINSLDKKQGLILKSEFEKMYK